MFSVELTRFPINEMVSESPLGGIYTPPPGFIFFSQVLPSSPRFYLPPPGFIFTRGIEVDPPSQG